MARLLILDDDSNTLASLSRAFRLARHEPVTCDNPAQALELLRVRAFDLVFSDVVMPGKDGIQFLEELRALGIQVPVVMISGQATIEMAVRATRLGALDFLEKPLSTERLLLTVENALKLRRLEDENRQLKQRIGKHELVYEGPVMKHVVAQIQRVAASESRACICGETGTGKELVARAIHDNSPRRDKPFLTLNCAAVPTELIESEMFGHEKGAFTGAISRHLGKFQQADGGTLFLDEIGDMPLPMQTKLLRVLEEGEIERIGGDRPVAVNVRVVTATHRDLEALVREQRFRPDLFHRIYVFPLRLPPLRERREDIPALVRHFTQQVVAINNWKPREVTEQAVAALQSYSWPGNVRELRNVVERLLLLADSEVDAETVALALPGRDSGAPASGTLAERVAAFERETVAAELKRRSFQMTETAHALGLERSYLYKKCEQLGLDLRTLRDA